MAIAAANTAIQAIVAAGIVQLYQTSQVNALAEMGLGHFTGLFHQVSYGLGITSSEQRSVLV
jgi:hypothetical protein